MKVPSDVNPATALVEETPVRLVTIPTEIVELLFFVVAEPRSPFFLSKNLNGLAGDVSTFVRVENTFVAAARHGNAEFQQLSRVRTSVEFLTDFCVC